MVGGSRKRDGVASRTRTYWAEYYRNSHNELKRKDPDSGGVDGRGKRTRDLVCYEPGRDGNGALMSGIAGNLKIEDDEDVKVETLKDGDSDDDGVKALKCGEGDEDIKVETLKDGDSDDDVKALKCVEDNEDIKVEILKDGDNDDDDEALECGEDDEDIKVVEILKDGDSDDDDEALECGEDDEDIKIVEILKDGNSDDDDDDVGEALECGEDDEDIKIVKILKDGNSDDDDEALECGEDDEDEGIEVLRSDKDGYYDETLNCEEDDEDEGDEVSGSDDSGIVILNCDKDNSVDMLKSDGAGILNCDKDNYSAEMLKSDEDYGVGSLRGDEDDVHGVDNLTCDVDDYKDDDENSVEYLGEIGVSNDCSSLKIETESISGSGLNVGDLDEVVSTLAEGFENTTKEADILGISGECSGGEPQIKPLDVEQIHRDISVDSDSTIGSRNSAEDSDGSDESVDSQMSESEPTSEEEDERSDEDFKDDESSTSESSDDSHHVSDDRPVKDDRCDVGENDNVMNEVEESKFDTVEDKRTPDTHGSSTIGSRNSAEDSDGSDESVDSQVSESEPTCEEDDELSDEDFKHDESSTSESLDDSHHDSDDRPVKDNRCAVGENDNVMKEVEESKFDTVEDRRTPDTHGSSRRKNLRKGSDTGQEKDDESGEGSNEDDQRTRQCKRSNQHKWNDEIFVANVEKSSRVRKSKPDLGRDDDEVDERVRKSARKKQKGDDEEETKSHKEKPVHGKWSPHVPFEFASTTDKGCKSLNEFFTGEKISDQQYSVEKVQLDSKKSRSVREYDLMKILIDSINSVKENQYKINENALDDGALPLKFRFEDEVVPPPEKSEWEMHIDSLFCDLDLGLLQSETDCTDNVLKMEDDDLEATVEVDESPAACCSRGKHHAILDEQIGIICKYCNTLIMGIKHVLPPFYTPTQRRRDRYYYYDDPPSSFFGEIQFQGSAATSYRSCSKGTVWDLIPGVEKELYPHQLEGFEFIWRNIAGDTVIEKLKQTLADDVRGCIISHAPGTGKTRLTIVFLQSFLKLYPACSPMIIAPKGMLLSWEAEFKKWNFNVVFHNLNKKELSGKENAVDTQLPGLAGCGILSKDCIRLLKLYSWSRGGSILGISYTLFVKLSRENGRGEGHEKIREVLLERAGLLVLDEGHTPRNDQSMIWKALTKVTTQRRIILSGTPFQNNLKELYNTLCVVNPKYANQEDTNWGRKRWRRNLAGRGDALKLKTMLDPYVHVHKGTILEESLPGLRHTLVFLHPTECQKSLLKRACKESIIFRRIRMVSLISVHPSINTVVERYSAHHSKLKEMKSDIDAGVKARFLMKLIQFSDALGERVLVFSQFIDSLIFIKEQLDSSFSWKEGREVLYMDGQLDERKRQESIYAMNDEKSEAKVMLASEKACSEGINLVGASRVVLLDTVWNPSVEKQAISRAYRIGQKKVVHVYRLFTSGIEVRQYAHQIHKERVSQWVFSLGNGHACRRETVSEDRVLETMRDLPGFKHIFEKIISQPKESDLIKTFQLQS